MKFLCLIIILNLYAFKSFPQIFSGNLINEESGEPIPYANIGILGKNIGTVSDAAGRFDIELQSRFDGDTLCISCIGYESRKYIIREFKGISLNTELVRIELAPIVYRLNEVVIHPVNKETVTLGNLCDSNSCYGNSFNSKELGTEIGVIIKLPDEKSKAYLKTFRFYVGKFTFDKFQVRLNIYDLKDALPNENILTEAIFTEINSAGEYTIDLKRHNLVTEGDFFIALEYYKIPDNAEGELVFCAVHNPELYKGNGYYRMTSHGKWMPEFGDNLGFSVQADIEVE